MTGREFQHLEDLVFCEQLGAHRAVYILKNLENFNISIKWDGNPTIYFGRDGNGKFTLVGKNGWGKDWMNSPEELEQWTLSRGKNEAWRPAFAKSLADMWRLIEPHCNFRGFVYADVLWNPSRPCVIGSRKPAVFFKPNQVWYTVQSDNQLYTEIVNSKLGIAVHSKFEHFGDHTGVPLYKKLDIPSADVVVVPQTVISQGIDMPTDMITVLEKKVKKHEDSIESLFYDRPGLRDFRDIIYKYVNYMNREDAFDDLLDLEKFKTWIDDSNLSINKQGRMRDIIASNAKEFGIMFELFLDIVSIKNLIISRLDNSPTSISAYSMTSHGGEGFVVQEPKVKLVPRNFWKPRSFS